MKAQVKFQARLAKRLTGELGWGEAWSSSVPDRHWLGDPHPSQDTIYPTRCVAWLLPVVSEAWWG